MIPKVIHYCWFGQNPLPEDVKKYILTWKKYCPDYEIVEWNEKNFDVNQNRYCREAYESKKWAFVSDYARLKILYDNGGIYMDTDVEVCKPFDDLLSYNAWSGFESDKNIPTGTMAADKYNKWIKYLLGYYDNKSFIGKNNICDLTTNVEIITRMTKKKYNILLNNTKQIFGDNYVLFPFEYLCAKDQKDGSINLTYNTYTIHHFKGSWLPDIERERNEYYRSYYKKYSNLMPESIANIISKFLSRYKAGGIKGVVHSIRNNIIE